MWTWHHEFRGLRLITKSAAAVLLGCIIGLTLRTTMERPAIAAPIPVGEKWEYCFVEANAAEVFLPDRQLVGAANGTTNQFDDLLRKLGAAPRPSGVIFEVYLANVFGADGWEFVQETMEPGLPPERAQKMIFRRAKR